MTWFNYLHRRIPAQPRKLVSNPSLVCPAEVVKGWTILQQEVKNGTDLTPRLSRKIEDADYNDGIAEVRFEYDTHGNSTKESYFGLEGKPMLNKYGIAELRR